jgi:hypothetical protein
MKPYIKLKNKFVIGEFSVQELKISYGIKVDDIFRGISYSGVKLENKNTVNTIFNIIPERFRKYFYMNIMEISTQVPAHTDSDISCTINFYMKTGSALTQFYTIKNENAIRKQVKNQTNGYMFDIEDLEPTYSFIAESNQAYLLDGSKPHSVLSSETSNLDRSAIVLQTDRFTFDDVSQMLKETHSI